jgi:hypothetical protein
MNFKVLQKQIEYKGCPLVIRQIGEHFEFITCINNLIYSSFIIAKKSLIQKILFQEYSDKQMKGITNYMIAMAQSTIDTVLEDNNTK